MRRSFVLAPLMLAVAIVAGCSSSPITGPATVSSSPPTSVTPGPAPQGAASMGTPAPVAMAPLAPHLDPKNLISTERSVYFDFEDVSIKPAYASLVERQGKYLASKPSLSITIEGNTDERGGSEYNLALGQKRADAVLRALKIYGVKDAQMEAVSWGKERPKATGHAEAVWVQNRRADIVYPVQ